MEWIHIIPFRKYNKFIILREGVSETQYASNGCHWWATEIILNLTHPRGCPSLSWTTTNSCCSTNKSIIPSCDRHVIYRFTVGYYCQLCSEEVLKGKTLSNNSHQFQYMFCLSFMYMWQISCFDKKLNLKILISLYWWEEAQCTLPDDILKIV